MIFDEKSIKTHYEVTYRNRDKQYYLKMKQKSKSLRLNLSS